VLSPSSTCSRIRPHPCCGSRTDDFFSGTVRRNTAEHYGEANQSRFVQRGTSLEMEEWHVCAALWTPDAIRFYIDGQLQGSGRLVRFHPAGPAPVALQLEYGLGGREHAHASMEPELDVFVDWVRVWQREREPLQDKARPRTPSGLNALRWRCQRPGEGFVA
jgi:Concanavalin A-like lectin/glucanases superfamily